MSGYTDCACRDCFEIAIGEAGEAVCHECEKAGCLACCSDLESGHHDDCVNAGMSRECSVERDPAEDGMCEHLAWVCSECGHGKEV